MNTIVKARVEDELKSRSEAILKQMGLDMTSAIRMFLSQVVMREALPFEVKVLQPNARTMDAIAQSYTDNLESVDSVDAMSEETGSGRRMRHPPLVTSRPKF